MNKKRENSMDMLNGSLFDKILLFAIPLAVGSILQQLFNAVDMAVVGRFASSEALAAVGGNAPVVGLFVNFYVGLSVGSNVVIARFIGEERYDRVEKAVHTSIAVALICGVLMVGVITLVAKPLLEIMAVPPDVMDYAILYIRIYGLGMPFILLYNFGAAILRSVGNTKQPLYCLLVAGVVNATLNMIFVICFHMSVDGVAIATVISNVVSSGMVVYYLLHGDELVRLHIKKIRIEWSEFKYILRIGVPSGLQSVIFSSANACIQTSANSFGPDAMAGGTITMNAEFMMWYAVNGFNAAVMTFTSQNYGAKKYDRCKKVFSRGMLGAVLTTMVMIAGFWFAKDFYISFFTTKPEVAAYAVERMICTTLPYFLLCSYEIAGATLRGYGYSMTPTLLTIFGTCAVRVFWVFTVVPAHHTYTTLMIIYPISWIITGILVVGAHFIVRNRLFRRSL